MEAPVTGRPDVSDMMRSVCDTEIRSKSSCIMEKPPEACSAAEVWPKHDPYAGILLQAAVQYPDFRIIPFPRLPTLRQWH